jgi:hypothetical protein
VQTVWQWYAGGVHGTIHFHDQQSGGFGLTVQKVSQPQQFAGITAYSGQDVHNGCGVTVATEIDIALEADKFCGSAELCSFVMEVSQQSFDTAKRTYERIEDEYFQRCFRQLE